MMGMHIIIKHLTAADIQADMLCTFKHSQRITRKWVKIAGQWTLTDTNDLREWDANKRVWITEYMREQIARGGAVVGAWCGDTLIGFCCIDGILRGTKFRYVNLTMLFVDDDWHRRGIGKQLLAAVCVHARCLGATKLFISAIPSVDTVAFYQATGCTDAMEVITDFVDTENDRYMEYSL